MNQPINEDFRNQGIYAKAKPLAQIRSSAIGPAQGAQESMARFGIYSNEPSGKVGLLGMKEDQPNRGFAGTKPVKAVDGLATAGDQIKHHQQDLFREAEKSGRADFATAKKKKNEPIRMITTERALEITQLADRSRYVDMTSEFLDLVRSQDLPGLLDFLDTFQLVANVMQDEGSGKMHTYFTETRLNYNDEKGLCTYIESLCLNLN